MNKQELKKITDKIDGGLGSVEAWQLYRFASSVPKDSSIVEIGSWKGKSTVCLALGSKSGNGARVYAVDPHTGSPDHHAHGKFENTLEIFNSNIAKAVVRDIVTPIISTGEETANNWNKKVGLVFIDAQYHSEDLTRGLMNLWFNLLDVGGVILLHNTVPSVASVLEGFPLRGCEPVMSYVHKDIYTSNKFRIVDVAGTTSAIKKMPSASLATLLVNKFRWLRSIDSRIYYFLYERLTNLPAPLKRFLKKLH